MKKDAIILQKKKNTCIVKRNDVKRPWWFLLSELSSFFWNRKKNVNLIKKHVKIKIFVMLECLLKRLKY